ncbi:RICIN domain-containing protein [Streptomyces lonarensis]|uniref:RICIN domain-containing protein n=2 Tax=Streptomyces lonarensis TaxID=700599 RepID=A0A7X6CY96_9ACTN|nr:RICIN domain-containing protein [Streptomyces lonarensis]NJQ04767.1 RICIN domain-containing protein [Streptomyces lonarensis]
MDTTPPAPEHRDQKSGSGGSFSETFAGRPARPRRGLAPARRVYSALASAVAVSACAAAAFTLVGHIPGLGDSPAEAAAPSTAPVGATGDNRDPAPGTAAEPPEDEAEEEDEEEEDTEEEDEEETEEEAAPPPVEEVAADDAGSKTEEEAAAPPEEDKEPPQKGPAPPPPVQEPPVSEEPARERFPTVKARLVGLNGTCAQPRDGGVGSGVMITGCNGSGAQQWTFHSDGTLRNGGRCLSLSGGSTADGTSVVMDTCQGTSDRLQWRYSPSWDVVNIASNQCLDVANGDASHGTHLQIAWCSGNPAQKWDRS